MRCPSISLPQILTNAKRIPAVVRRSVTIPLVVISVTVKMGTVLLTTATLVKVRKNKTLFPRRYHYRINDNLPMIILVVNQKTVLLTHTHVVTLSTNNKFMLRCACNTCIC